MNKGKYTENILCYNHGNFLNLNEYISNQTFFGRPIDYNNEKGKIQLALITCQKH